MDEVEKLIQELKSGNFNARLNAAMQLGEIKDKRAVPALIKALGDENVFVRIGVVEALGVIRDSSAVPALIEALRDEMWTVQKSAAYELGDMIVKCKTIKELEEVEKGIDKGSAALRKGHIDKSILIDAQIEVAKLTRKIAKKKDELAPKRDLLLTDKPKPPKKGRGVYQTLKATVRL